MRATLYQPSQAPLSVEAKGFTLPTATTDFSIDAERAATTLGCAPDLVDVLALGLGYLVFSVFDCEGEPNLEAMQAVSILTGVTFDDADEDELLRGPVLVVTASAI